MRQSLTPAILITSCSLPEEIVLPKRLEDPAHYKDGSYAYTKLDDLNRELASLFRQFKEACETQGPDAPLSDIAKRRDSALHSHGCRTGRIFWTCPYAQTPKMREVIYPPIHCSARAPTQANIIHRTQDRK